MMITRILLLLLYFNLSSSGREYKIDFSRCTQDMKCFVRESCTVPSTAVTLKKLVKYANYVPLDGCDVIMQFKTYIEKKKYLVIIQVGSKANAQDVTNDGFSFVQGDDNTPDKVLFKCDKSGVVPHADFKTVNLAVQPPEEKTLLCAFTLEMGSVSSDFPLYFGSHNEKPRILFQTDAPQTVEYGSKKKGFWSDIDIATNCNPEMLLSTNKQDNTYIYHELDSTLFWPLKCEASQNLRKDDATNPVILGKNAQIECSGGDWAVYEDGDEKFEIKQAITVHCVEKICTLCSPLPALDCGSACSPPQLHNEAEKCHEYTCPTSNNLWQLDGGKEVSGELECKKDGSTINAAWFFKDGTAHPGKVEKAACSNKEICWTAATLVEDCPAEPEKMAGFPEGMECVKTLNKANSNSELSCQEGQELRWIVPTSNELKPAAKKITCDFATAKFKDSAGNEVVKDARVICLQTRIVDEKAEPAAAGMKMEYFYYGGGGVALFVVIGAIIGIVVITRRKKEAERKRKLPRTLGEDLHSIEAPSQQSVAQSAAPEEPKSDGVLPVLPRNAKGPWRLRDKQGEETWTKALKPDFFKKHFSEKAFISNCLADFNVLRQESRMEVFYYTFSFSAYAAQAENIYPFGHVRHAFELVKRLQVCQHDSHQNMSRAWRFVKLIGHLIMTRLKDKTQSKLLAKRVRLIMAAWARPILNDLGWKALPNEDRKDAELRWWAVRVLLWTGGEQDVMAELKRQAVLDIEELESPMRSIVLGYAVRYLGQHETLMTKYWPKVLENPKDPKKDEYGTMRQHVLFGLAMARDKKYAEVDFWEDHSEGEANDEYVKEHVFPRIYDFNPENEKHFTPQDLLWAVQGAAEHSGNARAAIEVHTAQLIKMKEEMSAKVKAANLDPSLTYTMCPLHVQLKANNPKNDAAFRSAFLRAFADTNEVLAECCADPLLWKDLTDAAYYIEQKLAQGWAKELGVQECGHKFDLYDKRVACQEDLFKNPKVATILSEAMKCCE